MSDHAGTTNMDAQTLTALKASIKHWQENVDAETPYAVSVDGRDCALCRMYYVKGCDGCPVCTKTMGVTCDGSPYHDAVCELSEWVYELSEGRDTKQNKAAWQKAAQAELDFLKSLLPEGETLE